MFRSAHESSPDYSSKKNPNSPYSTNLNPKYANRARFLITWQTSTRDPTGPNPHSVPNSNPGPKSRPQRVIYIFYTTFSSPIFLIPSSSSTILLFSLLLLHLPIFYIFFLSTTTTTFLLFPSSTNTTTTFMSLSLPLLFSCQTGQKGQPQAKIAKIRPKRPNSGQKGPTQRTSIVGSKTIGGVNTIEMWWWWWKVKYI